MLVLPSGATPNIRDLLELIRFESGGPTVEELFLAIFDLELKRVYLGHSLSQKKDILMPSGILRRFIIALTSSDLF